MHKNVSFYSVVFPWDRGDSIHKESVAIHESRCGCVSTIPSRLSCLQNPRSGMTTVQLTLNYPQSAGSLVSSEQTAFESSCDPLTEVILQQMIHLLRAPCNAWMLLQGKVSLHQTDSYLRWEPGVLNYLGEELGCQVTILNIGFKVPHSVHQCLGIFPPAEKEPNLLNMHQAEFLHFRGLDSGLWCQQATQMSSPDCWTSAESEWRFFNGLSWIAEGK